MGSVFFQDGTTPLILAAAGGHIDAVTELLHQGADPNAKRLVSSDLIQRVNDLRLSDLCGMSETRLYGLLDNTCPHLLMAKNS